MDRRDLLKATAAGLLGMGIGARPAFAQGTAEGEPFDFDLLVARAETAAMVPYVRPRIELSEPFADLTYDQFRAIRFRDAAKIWGGTGQSFALDVMPPGFYFQDKVRVHLVADGMAREVAFSTEFFEFHPNYFPYEEGRAPADLARDHGFSGLRLRHPINRPGVWDELAVFQGASYFRAVARDTFYGLSARGLAIGSGEPEPEEFPLFTEFWIEEPEEGATEIRVFSLLDSASVSGAYSFTIRPGIETLMDVRLALFPRIEIAKAGIAPLTSMYFFGPERRAGVDDFRDAVHDSSALQVINGAGETLWRPLANPASLQFSSFQDRDPRAFGLIQRQRDFDYFQDAEARYEMRPSAWIEPAGDWGEGAVVLVEIPTADEFADNIVAFWRPAEPLGAGRRHDFAYRLTWGRQPHDYSPLARVLATRSGSSILDIRKRVFVIDFDLAELEIDDLVPELTVSEGQIAGEIGISRLPGDGDMARVGFHWIADEAAAAEFRLRLADGDGNVVSEVWLYRWTAA